MTNVTYHRDSTVTLWNVYTQQWERGSDFADEVWASLDGRTRDRVMRHTAPSYAVVYDPADWGTIVGVGATAKEARAQAEQWIEEQIVDEPHLETVCYRLTESARHWLATHDGEPLRWGTTADGLLDIDEDCRVR